MIALQADSGTIARSTSIYMRTFSRRFLSLALGFIVLGVVGSARAGDVKYPAETPLLSVSVPEGWTSEISKGDLDITTSDGNVYFSISKTNKASALDATVSAKKFANGAGLTDITVEPNDDEEENGVKKKTAFITGKKGETEYLAIVGSLTLPGGVKCALFILGEKDSMVTHKKELEGIVSSIKPAK